MRLLEIGRTVKTHGLKGDLKVLSYLESHDHILPTLKEIFLGKDQGAAAPFRLRDAEVKGSFIYLRLEGIDHVDQARTLLGHQVFIPSDLLEDLPDDEYYWHEIIGLKVMTEDGNVLGHIEEIFPAGSHEVYVCSGGGREILLPSIGEVIRNIDKHNGIMTVRLLEGL
jgi:16S rRNA processing protein RimM